MKHMEGFQICEGFLPVDMSAAANNGDYVSLKNYDHVMIVFYGAVGTAGDDPTLTVQQAQDVSGTGAKALNFTTIYVKQAATNLQGTATFTKTTQTAANTYTDADAAEQALIWVVEFDAEELDVSNGFDCVRATVADVGTNAQLGSLLYILTESRYPQETPLTAIAD